MSAASPIELTSLENIANCLEHQIVYNDNHGLVNMRKSSFDAKLKTEISFQAYLKKLFQTVKMDIKSMHYALVLLDAYCSKRSIYFTKLNCFKLLIVCILISVKLNEDYIPSDKDFARASGIKLSCLIKLEIEFLETLDYKVTALV